MTPAVEPETFRLLLELGDTWSDTYEPSMWLRLRAQAAALALAADGPMPRGRYVVPLVPHLPSGQCSRCEFPAEFHAGFEATSDALPGVTLVFTFRLCRRHRAAEYPEHT
ncbi:hypothetical protein [Isoptericola sp. NPDC058082]|uniref:hypothetical protein n=1 Tax=Isoptericola sp. NPDC058082 TaxID=3346331 RepID=UPI0036E51AAE